MKLSKPAHSMQTLASLAPMILIGGASLLFSGCLMNANENAKEKSAYDSDGQSAYMATEVDQMGQVYDQMPSTDAALKTSASGITITGELVIEPFKYDEGCACFIRHAVYTGQAGYERDRIDSVTLLDSTGATMSRFNKSKVAKIIHKRNVTKTKDAKQADIRFDITVDIKNDAGVRKGEWNGTMSGSFNGQEFKSGSMTKVIRVWENGRFHFPEAGIIELDRPVFHFLAEFLGDGKAKFTITNKVNQKIHIIFVDSDYHETDPVDAP